MTQEASLQINEGVEQAYASRGLQPYWLPGVLQIHSGPHAGQYLLPFSDSETRVQIMREGFKIEDFPEFESLVAMLGGLSARVEISDEDLRAPEEV